METDDEDDDPVVADSPAHDWDVPPLPALEKAGQLSILRVLLATVAAAVAFSWFWPGAAYWSGSVRLSRGQYLRGGGHICLCCGQDGSGPRPSRPYRLTRVEIWAVDIGVVFVLAGIVFGDQIFGLVRADLCRRPRYHRRSH